MKRYLPAADSGKKAAHALSTISVSYVAVPPAVSRNCRSPLKVRAGTRQRLWSIQPLMRAAIGRYLENSDDLPGPASFPPTMMLTV